jgi:hypothetical protein
VPVNRLSPANAPIAALVLLTLLPGQCIYASEKFPDYPLRKAGDCPIKSEHEGFLGGIQPMEDLQEQKTYFHAEVGKKGFIPVYVVLENTSSTDSYLFDKTTVGYGDYDKGATDPNLHSKTEAWGALGGLVVMHMISNATEVQQNILKKEIQSKTLRAGSSVGGFLYIPAPKSGFRDKIHIQIPIAQSGTGETFVLNFVF